jgi:peptide/nickel transport system substrate-binding protein
LSAERQGPRIERRQALLVGALAATGLAVPRGASARGRIHLGGALSLRVPWPLSPIDPHRLDDPAALLFGGCLFDALFAPGPRGAVVPALAETLPEPTSDGLRIPLRKGLRFASGKPLTPRDVAQSIARSRSLAGRGWLDGVGSVRAVGTRGSADGTLVVSGRSADHVARALASPLTAIVPEQFNPDRPEGTGPFVALESGGARPGGRVLGRNRYAASGPSILDHLAVGAADDLAASLRAFESGEDDVGWLGLGLHEPRHGAVAFDAGELGWAILRTGDQVGRWNLPGVAQRLADGIDPSRVAHLGVAADWTVEPDDGWGGPPVSLLVRNDSPWLVDLARAVAAALSRPDHEVTPTPTPLAELRAAVAARTYALALDVTRPFDPTPLGTYAALASADDPARGAELMKHPPLGLTSARAAGRFLRVGVVAGIRMAGGRMADLHLPLGPAGVGVDFGSIIHPRPRVL